MRLPRIRIPKPSVDAIVRVLDVTKFVLIGITTAYVISLSVKQAEQLAATKQVLDQQAVLLTELQNATDKTNRHLDCIAAFFNQEDRANVKIADIDHCVLSRDSNPEDTYVPSFPTTPVAQSAPTPTPDKSPRDCKKPVLNYELCRAND